jgi:putative ABC transport system permease protein
VPDGFDDELVDTIRRMPAVATAEGRRRVNTRIELKPSEFLNLNLYAISDYGDMRVNKIQPDTGAWPPTDHQILLERSTLGLAELAGLEVGDTLIIKTSGDKRREMKVAGLVQDFTQMPARAEGRAYGYVTLETLAWLAEPESLNQLNFVVAENRLDEAHIWEVAAEIENKIEKSGRSTEPPVVPEPGEYPVLEAFTALVILLGTLGSLSLFGGGFLMVNTINGLLTQQKRQIGVMKAIGAQSGQILGIYFSLVFILSLLALMIGLPVAAWGGSQLSRGLAYALNVDLIGSAAPPKMLLIEAAIGFAVPFLAAAYPIMSGVKVTVREAINDYGVAGSSQQGTFDRFLGRIRGLPRPVILSIRNTFRRKGRMALTLIALTLSGAIFISAYNIRASLLLTLEGIFAYRNYDVIFFFEQPYRTAKTERILASMPDVSRIESFHRTGDAYRVKGGKGQGNNYNVTALQPENTAFRPPLSAGRWLQSEDQAVMVVNDALLRDEADIRLGNTVLFEIEDRQVPLQVVGVVEEARGQPTLYLNYAYFARMLGDVGRANAAWAEVTRPEQSAATIKAMEAQFERAGLRVARITSAADEKRFFEEHFFLITGFMTIAAILLAVVGGLSLMGTMSINVMERVREIGVMRAIGASNGAIQRIFVTEGVVIGLISWVLSLIAGLIPTKFLGDAVGIAFLETPLDYTFSPGGMLVWLVIVVGVAALSTFVPAESAAQIKVNELLGYE